MLGVRGLLIGASRTKFQINGLDSFRLVKVEHVILYLVFSKLDELARGRNYHGLI